MSPPPPPRLVPPLAGKSLLQDTHTQEKAARKHIRGVKSENNIHVEWFGSSANGGGAALLDCKLPALLSRGDMNKNVLWVCLRYTVNQNRQKRRRV